MVWVVNLHFPQNSTQTQWNYFPSAATDAAVRAHTIKAVAEANIELTESCSSTSLVQPSTGNRHKPTNVDQTLAWIFSTSKQDLSHEEPDFLGLLEVGESYSLKTGMSCLALESNQRDASSFPCPEPSCSGRFGAFPAWHKAAVLVANCSQQCTLFAILLVRKLPKFWEPPRTWEHQGQHF